MNTYQDLFNLLSENSVFSAFAAGGFAVFLFGAYKALLYLAGSKSPYLFDSMQLASYFDKTGLPEPIRLRIFFLSFPRQEKLILSSYLDEPQKTPSEMFSRSLEKLKMDIMEKTNYNRTLALIFFLVGGFCMLASETATINTKLMGIFALALFLAGLCVLTEWLNVLIKFLAYSTFKKMLYKFDGYHPLYVSKYKSGITRCVYQESANKRRAQLEEERNQRIKSGEFVERGDLQRERERERAEKINKESAEFANMINTLKKEMPESGVSSSVGVSGVGASGVGGVGASGSSSSVGVSGVGASGVGGVGASGSGSDADANVYAIRQAIPERKKVQATGLQNIEPRNSSPENKIADFGNGSGSDANVDASMNNASIASEASNGERLNFTTPLKIATSFAEYQSEKKLSPAILSRPTQNIEPRNSSPENKIADFGSGSGNIDSEPHSGKIETLLNKIKTATDNLDFECFETLSADLGKTIDKDDLSATDHQTLQNMLDEYLEQYKQENQM